jgi:hypothetical protein
MQADKARELLKSRSPNTLQGEPWEPTSPGDHILGEVHSYSEKDTKYGPKMLLLLWDEHGEKREVWCNAVLENEIKEAGGVEPGDTVAIRFDGEEDTGKGNPAKVYSFVRVQETEKSRTFEPNGEA